MGQPTPSINSLLQLGNGQVTETFATIALCQDINGPGRSNSTITTTNQDNPDGCAEFIGGLKDGGSVTTTVYFDPDEATHTGPVSSLETCLEDGLVHNWRILVRNAQKEYTKRWVFKGVLIKSDFKAPLDGVYSSDIEIKCSGWPKLETHTEA